MVSFLKKLPRGKRVALYTLGSQLRMVQGFTDDTDTLIAAAEQLSTRPHSVYTNNRELSATIGELAESGLKKSPRAYEQWCDSSTMTIRASWKCAPTIRWMR